MVIQQLVNAYSLKEYIICVLNLCPDFCVILSFPCDSSLDIQSDQGQTNGNFDS